MKGTHDLRHGVLWKQILLFALPIAATSMLQQLFNSADVAVVGQFSAQKELALAAVGSTSSIVNLYITIFTGLAVGANVVIARLIGAEEEGEVRKAVHTSLVVAVLCGAVLFRERNLRSKAVDLAFILVGMFFLWLGSRPA